MKYIKRFEKIDKIKDLKKLFNHLVDVFSNYYSYNTTKFETNHEVLFYNSDTKYMFSIRVTGYDGRHIFINKNENDGICSYILDYFKILNGLNIIEDSENRLICSIEDKNIENLINQISKDDFEIRYQSSKYNL